MYILLNWDPTIEIALRKNIQSKLEIIGVKLSKDCSIQQGPAINRGVLQNSKGMVTCTFF